VNVDNTCKEIVSQVWNRLKVKSVKIPRFGHMTPDIRFIKSVFLIIISLLGPFASSPKLLTF
jgi:hypothetical protein